LAVYQPSHSPLVSTADISAQLVHSADTALYHAKQNGRDRIAQGQPVLDRTILRD
jgi:GGDEF domain-containing protein